MVPTERQLERLGREMVAPEELVPGDVVIFATGALNDTYGLAVEEVEGGKVRFADGTTYDLSVWETVPIKSRKHRKQPSTDDLTRQRWLNTLREQYRTVDWFRRGAQAEMECFCELICEAVAAGISKADIGRATDPPLSRQRITQLAKEHERRQARQRVAEALQSRTEGDGTNGS